MALYPLKYIRHIDGLRAAAVLSVLLYHAEFNFGGKLFQGGWLGVDIFFVISGYLISAILMNEVTANGSLNLKYFFAARFYRLAPALLAMCSISFLTAFFLLPPRDLVNFSESAVSAIFGFSNFYFFFTQSKYGAPDSSLEALLHTWSLSVEFQFYLLFPLIILACISHRDRLLLCLLVIATCSLFCSALLSFTDVQLNFFASFTRFYEFVAGVIAYQAGPWAWKCINHKIRHVAVDFCFIAIIIFMVLPIGVASIPLSNLFVVFFSALLLIMAAQNDPELQTPSISILSSNLAVYCGKISYSLYLWHFPVFAFAGRFEDQLGNLDRLVLLVFSILIALLSYKFIEQPFRKFKQPKAVIRNLILGAMILVFCMFNIQTLLNGGFESRLPPILQEVHSTTPWLELRSQSTGDPCQDLSIEQQATQCVFQTGDTSSNCKNVLLLGDSHLSSIAKQLLIELNQNHKKNCFNVMSSLIGGCPFILDATVYVNSTETCSSETNLARLNHAKEFSSDIVVIMARYPVFVEQGWFEDSLGRKENSNFSYVVKFDNGTSADKSIISALNRLIENDSDLVLVYPTVEHAFHTYNEFHTRYQTSLISSRNANLFTHLDDYFERSRRTFEIFDQMPDNRVSRIYPHKLFCDADRTRRCKTHTTDQLYYADFNHLSDAGARLLARKVAIELTLIDR